MKCRSRQSSRLAVARLESRGVEVTWDDNFPGHERFYAFDQVGNRLEFLEPKQT
jgi:hypothetical protein